MGSTITSPPVTTEWVLLETLSPSAVTTITTSGNYTGYDRFYVEIYTTSTVSNDFMNLRVNGISTAVYGYLWISGTTVTATTAQTSMQIFRTNAAQNQFVPFFLSGETGAVANTFNVNIVPHWNQNSAMISGIANIGTTQTITSLTFMEVGTGNFTGTIRIYGAV